MHSTYYPLGHPLPTQGQYYTGASVLKRSPQNDICLHMSICPKKLNQDLTPQCHIKNIDFFACNPEWFRIALHPLIFQILDPPFFTLTCSFTHHFSNPLQFRVVRDGPCIHSSFSTFNHRMSSAVPVMPEHLKLHIQIFIVDLQVSLNLLPIHKHL